MIIPAPTVPLLDSSIRMKLPVRRLLVYGSNTSGELVRRRTRAMSLRLSSAGAGVAFERVHVDEVLDLLDDRRRVAGGVLDHIAPAGAQRLSRHPADVGFELARDRGRLVRDGRSARRARRRARPRGAA